MSNTPTGALHPHDRYSDWLVDEAGVIWSREREFTCEHHPYGPDREDGDEYSACEQLVLGIWRVFSSAAAIATCTGADPDLIERTRIELNFCCRGHRWRDTDRFTRVRSLEVFMRDMPLVKEHRSALLEAINNHSPLVEEGGDALVRIPLVVHPPKPGEST